MKKFLFRRRTLSLALAITLVALTLAGPAFAQALAITTNDFVPFAQINFVPCANGGAGELVQIQGTLHIQQHITINDNRATIKSHFQPQGAGGTGLTTGDTYNAVGVTQEVDTLALTAGATEFTFVNNFRLIGQGPDNNLQVHQLVHVTINANGTVTNVIDNSSVECH
jgi:hypothetical protein